MTISDLHGPTASDENLSALVVSGDSRSQAKAWNNQKEKDWYELAVFGTFVIAAEDLERRSLYRNLVG